MGSGTSSPNQYHRYDNNTYNRYQQYPQSHYNQPSAPSPQDNTSRRSSRPESEVRYWDTSPRDWDVNRDTVYSRILSAEEFLNSMNRIDDDVRELSQREDRERHMTKITENMGLRGHLHGELLRIERMLAEDDPSLKCIAEYEVSHADVVEKLRELRDEGSRIQISGGEDAMAQVDLLLKDRGLTVVCSGTNTETTDQGTVGIQSGGNSKKSGNKTKTKSKMIDADTSIDYIDNTKDLKKKHKAEEDRMAARYAKVIARGRQMSLDEINSLLSDHARSVQALRMKQEEEKRRLKEKLLQKRKVQENGLTGEGHDDDENSDSNKKTVKSKQKGKDLKSGKEMQNGSEEDLRRGRRKSSGQYNGEDASRVLNDHTAALNGLRSKQETEKQKFQRLLQEKRAEQARLGQSQEDLEDELMDELDNRGIIGGSRSEADLEELVHRLEDLRSRGLLTDDVLNQLLSRYQRLSADTSTQSDEPSQARRSSRPFDNETNKISAAQLLEETQAKQKHIKSKRQQEKDVVAEKLRRKLQAREFDGLQVELEDD